ncbi:hypothetical protein [Paenibacillus segetis]|uniref:hypothetical protein n=1 Tax=Paenibacillus segetis TaxID=1325360 RepID=UPI001E60697F|nr:hypothetical protein [Paenibacillus segetis]
MDKCRTSPTLNTQLSHSNSGSGSSVTQVQSGLKRFVKLCSGDVASGREQMPPTRKSNRSEDWINQRVQRLLVAAKQNPFQQTMYASHLINLKVLITLILQYKEHLTGLEQNIERAMLFSPPVQLLQYFCFVSYTPFPCVK